MAQPSIKQPNRLHAKQCKVHANPKQPYSPQKVTLSVTSHAQGRHIVTQYVTFFRSVNQPDNHPAMPFHVRM